MPKCISATPNAFLRRSCGSFFKCNCLSAFHRKFIQFMILGTPKVVGFQRNRLLMTKMQHPFLPGLLPHGAGPSQEVSIKWSHSPTVRVRTRVSKCPFLHQRKQNISITISYIKISSTTVRVFDAKN